MYIYSGESSDFKVSVIQLKICADRVALSRAMHSKRGGNIMPRKYLKLKNEE